MVQLTDQTATYDQIIEHRNHHARTSQCEKKNALIHRLILAGVITGCVLALPMVRQPGIRPLGVGFIAALSAVGFYAANEINESGRKLSLLDRHHQSATSRLLSASDYQIARELTQLKQTDIEAFRNLPGTATPPPITIPEKPPTETRQLSPVNPVSVLSESMKSLLICGVSGAGKGVLLLQLLDAIHCKFPAVAVMVMNPKDSDTEPGARSRASQGLYRGYSLLTNPSPMEVGGWVNQCLDDWAKITGPKLLVVDELASLTALLQSDKTTRPTFTRLVTLIRQVVQMGSSESQWVIGVTQESNVSALGMNSQSRGSLLAVFLVNGSNLGAADSYLSGNWLKPPTTPLKELCALSPCNRAVYLGGAGEWYPLAAVNTMAITGDDRTRHDLTQYRPRHIGLVPDPIEVKRTRTTTPLEDAITAYIGAKGPVTAIKLSTSLTPSKLRAPTATMREAANRLVVNGVLRLEGKAYHIVEPHRGHTDHI